MELVVVGSGTVVPAPDRVCAAYYVETGPHRVLLDCGPGALHHMARFDVPWSRLTHLALTHFHNDHIGDVPILFFALKYGLAEPRREPLTVIGPAGTADLLRRLASAFGSHLLDPGFRVHVHELLGGESFALDAARMLRAHATRHTDESVAYRLDTPDGSLGYTGDTGPDDALGGFFHRVDLLLAECSLPDAIASPSHLSPSSTAALARKARPAELLITHVYPQLGYDHVAERVRAARWTGKTTVAEDGLRVNL